MRSRGEVTIGVGGDLLDGLAGVMSQHLFEAGFHSLDLSGDELNVGRLPLCAGVGLVDRDASVRECQTLAADSGGEQDCGGNAAWPKQIVVMSGLI